MLWLLRVKGSHKGSHLLVIIYLKPLLWFITFPPNYKVGWVLVNLTNVVVQLLQPILICLKAKGKGGTRGR